MYWETLSRWISQRARRDAVRLGVPCVFLQAIDECNTIDGLIARRLLNVPNLHNTGHIHGVLPAHVGMEVRFTMKLNSEYGLVQEQRATIVAFLFHAEDQVAYKSCLRRGELFRPKFCPHGIWLRVHDFEQSPIWQEARPFLGHTRTLPEQEGQLDGHVREWISHQADLLAQSLLLYRPVQQEFTWRSSETHTVRRIGFPLTHGRYLTSTSAQGQTLRCGTVIDCARAQSHGFLGLCDDQWWLHLYVMFSRVTCMRNMLLLRPPPREFLERGPPPSLLAALQRFEEQGRTTTEAAAELARKMGVDVPSC
jgi:hypothetical protein